MSEFSAQLVEAMMDQEPWRRHVWARVALAIAARAVRRGRHLTDAEKLENLATAMEEDGTKQGARAAAKLRSGLARPEGKPDDRA